MWAILGILVVTIGIVLFEVPHLLNRGAKKDILVFFVLLSIGVGLSVLMALGIEIPNPFDLLTIIYQPITDLILGVLE